MTGAENLPKIDDTSATITDLASDIENFGGAVGDTQLASSPGVPDWAGESGDTYNTAVIRFRGHLNALKLKFPRSPTLSPSMPTRFRAPTRRSSSSRKSRTRPNPRTRVRFVISTAPGR